MQRNVFAWHLSEVYVTMDDTIFTFQSLIFETFTYLLNVMYAFYLLHSSLRQSYWTVSRFMGLKDSHHYPSLTSCHCRDPAIAISAPHETFIAP